MKVILINPPIAMSSRLWFPLGIAYVASYLLKNGFQVEIIDAIGENLTRARFIERIKKVDSRIFGIGGLTTAFNAVVDIAKYIRDMYPDAFIFAGNTVGYSIPEILMRNSEVEAIVLGEGEITTCELVNAIQNHTSWTDIKGVAYKDKNGQIHINQAREPIANIDDLPFPAWHLLPIENYFKNVGERYCIISTVRGCPYSCIYCCKTYMGYKARQRSPMSLMKELLEFDRLYHFRRFYMWDDLSILNKKKFIQFCKLKMKSSLRNKPYSCSGRSNLIDEELTYWMKKSKCFQTGMGVESFDQEVLDGINKHQTLQDIEKAIKIWRKYGLDYSGTSLMIGMVNETRESVKKSRDFCIKYGLTYRPHCFTAFPSTKLYEYALKEGLITDELKYIKELSKQGNTGFFLINYTKNFTKKELIHLRYSSMYFPPLVNKLLLKSIAAWLYHRITRSFWLSMRDSIKKQSIGTIIKENLNSFKSMFVREPIKDERYSNIWK